MQASKPRRRSNAMFVTVFVAVVAMSTVSLILAYVLAWLC
jgi:phage shock protein PspC (stress-responsive transcriptional regulator)